MVSWKLVFLGVLIVVFPYILQFILSFFNMFINFSVYVIISILLAGIIFILSAFVPARWRKSVRKVSYLSLFLGILLLEISIISPYLIKSEISIEECKTLFPSVTEAPEEKVPFWNALGAVSCVLIGYFPVEHTPLGMATFFIFYLLLPFVFIFAYIYGLMVGIGISEWFGSIGGSVTRVLSLVIALYAARLLFGHVLLQFLGYGAWGLVAIFIPIFIVKGLEHMMEKMFGIEEYYLEKIKTEKDIKKGIHKYVSALRESLLNIQTPKDRLEAVAAIVELDEFAKLKGHLGRKNPHILNIQKWAMEAERILIKSEGEGKIKGRLTPYHEVLKILDDIDREVGYKK